MSKPVVLVLGNDSFATRVAELARDAGNTVTLASPAAKEMDKIRTVAIDPSSHDSILGAFETTLAAYGRINAILSAFVPQPGAKDAIPGADQTALRTALDPSIRVTKIALYYARRTVGDKAIAWLAISGDDVIAQTSAGAIAGAYRSMMPRFSAQGMFTALVNSEAADDATARALVACIRPNDTPAIPTTGVAAPPLPKRFNTKVLQIENGKLTVTHPLQGTPCGFQYDHVFARMANLVMFIEDATRWKISGRVRTLASLGVVTAITLLLRQYGYIGPLSLAN